MATKRKSTLPLICLICGDIARGINFNLMTCMSCKTFFRRHALKSKKDFQCQMENDCEITKLTRGNCTACRLKKCFVLGMNPKLIGYRSRNKTKFNHIRYLKMINKKKYQLPSQPLPLNLLENDYSTLTNNEWTLLSNIIHAYDMINIIPQAKYLLEQQISLPPKIRSKPSAIFNIVKQFYSVIQPLVERTSYFPNLSTDTYCTLVRRNAPIFGTINSIFIMREINAFDHLAFLNGCSIIYGNEGMKHFDKLTAKLEKNGILIKIMLLIVAFSTNCSIVLHDNTENMTSISSLFSIVSIQNVIVTMFWKYLVYQYGFVLAVRLFNSFIKYALDALQILNEQSNVQHNDMVDTVIEETTRLLTIED